MYEEVGEVEMKVARVEARTASGESCIGAKRIYSDSLILKWECPECKSPHRKEFNKVPLISYGHYCHCFYCEHCGYESGADNKMYKLVDTNDDSVDLVFSKSNNLKAFYLEFTYREL